VLTLVSTYVFDGVVHDVVIGESRVRRRRGRPGWTKVDGCIWQHVSGWQVHHCGHPTANWPYYGVRPDGTVIVMPNNTGFRHLVEAQEAVEHDVAGASSPAGGAATAA
jgi:hypothetical protein